MHLNLTKLLLKKKLLLGICIALMAIISLNIFSDTFTTYYANWAKVQCEKQIEYKVNFSFADDTFAKERAFVKQYYEEEYGDYARADIEDRTCYR